MPLGEGWGMSLFLGGTTCLVLELSRTELEKVFPIVKEFFLASPHFSLSRKQ